ncbi:MAG: hypothetical protein AAFX03_13385 [Pseudomonadota bacterium]
MAEERTKGWAAVGIGLILLSGAIYIVAVVFGVGLLINEAAEQAGSGVFGAMVVPGLGALGFLILLAKVIVDRLGNAEDDYYSKNVDR